jgi:hypothetical protein
MAYDKGLFKDGSGSKVKPTLGSPLQGPGAPPTTTKTPGTGTTPQDKWIDDHELIVKARVAAGLAPVPQTVEARIKRRAARAARGPRPPPPAPEITLPAALPSLGEAVAAQKAADADAAAAAAAAEALAKSAAAAEVAAAAAKTAAAESAAAAEKEKVRLQQAV